MSNTTNVVGYYNGNRWPIQVVASKFNVTLTLKSGEYILDRKGRKVNDPYFEVFANNKQLHRELSNKPVPIIAIPEVTAANVVTQPTNPVKAVTEWTRDVRGHKQPVIPEPEPQPQPQGLPNAVVASATESVRPMTMDQARKLGYIRKVREVPEDYGVNDTTGLPPSGIPKMKYAIDPTVNKPAPPLPKEMLALPKDDPNRQTRSQLVAGLSQSNAAPAPEDVNPFANAGVANAPAASPIQSGSPIQESEQPEPVEEAPPEEIEDAPQAEEVVEEADVAPALPEPDLTEVATPEPAPEPVKPPLKPLTPKNNFVCMACGAPHKFRSQLLKHAQSKHPERVNAIMASYPETPTLP